MKHLKMCLDVGQRDHSIDLSRVKQKMQWLEKAKKKREKKKIVDMAQQVESEGDHYAANDEFDKARKCYEKALKMCKNVSVEAEANIQFKLGKMLYSVYHDFVKAKMHLADFKILGSHLKNYSLR